MLEFTCGKMNGFKEFPMQKHSLMWGCCIFSQAVWKKFPHLRLPSVGNCHPLKILVRDIFGCSYLVNSPTAIMQFPFAVGLVYSVIEEEGVFLEDP